jgi:hypothetical protein
LIFSVPFSFFRHIGLIIVKNKPSIGTTKQLNTCRSWEIWFWRFATQGYAFELLGGYHSYKNTSNLRGVHSVRFLPPA